MPKADSDLIFESYFHAITDAINEARGRKKQFSERVKQIITDPKTGEQRLESYYEMMQRLRRQELMSQADAESEAESEVPAEAPVEAPIEAPAKPEVTAEIEPDEDVDVDISASPIEDVGDFNFNNTLTLGDNYENAPTDSMTQDIVNFISDTPSTGQEVVDFLVSKGVNEADAKNKVASLAMLDILKHFFGGEEASAVEGEIEIPEVDETPGETEEPEELDLTLKSFLKPKSKSGMSEEEKRKDFVQKVMAAIERKKSAPAPEPEPEDIDTDTEFSEEDEPVDPEELY